MTFNEYQEKTRKSAIYPDLGHNLIYPTIGLAGETGEVAEKIKKIIRDRGGLVSESDRLEISKELGDVLWYLAQISSELGLEFETVANGNLEKISSRQERDCLHGQGDNR